MRSFLKPIFFLLLGATFFSLPSCKDECDGVVCYNGGVCDDGKCGCPSNYTGENCETKVQSKDPNDFSFEFLRIEIIDFPDLKNGVNWDDSTQCDANGALPDIFFTLEAKGELLYTSSAKVNCSPNVLLNYQDGFPIPYFNAYETFVIKLYDQDNGQCFQSEYMGGIQGKLSDNLAEIQSVKILSNPIAEIEVKIVIRQ